MMETSSQLGPVSGDKDGSMCEVRAGPSIPSSRSTSRYSTQLPLTRVKNIIKSDPDITLASQEATMLISKATEMFVRHISQQAHVYTVKGKRKTIQRKDIDSCLPHRDELAFLEGAID